MSGRLHSSSSSSSNRRHGRHGGDNVSFSSAGANAGAAAAAAGAAPALASPPPPPGIVGRNPTSLSDVRARRDVLHHNRLSNMSESDRQRVNRYLHGGTENMYRGAKRRDALELDDMDEDDALADDSRNEGVYRTNNALDTSRTGAGASARARRRRHRPLDRSHVAKMELAEARREEAAVMAADAESILHTERHGQIQTENDLERTYKLTQTELKRQHLDEQTRRHIFDLDLRAYGPYRYAYDRSGRMSLLMGNSGNGHVALMDCHSLSLKTELHVGESVRDGTFLHNGTMLALAQKHHVFVYDDGGTEIHRIDEHRDVFGMTFLPYHWLLATVGRQGILRYLDTSTGDLVSRHRTKLGPCRVVAQNPSNAIVHLGHANGTVTLWSPAQSTYLVKMLCHKGSSVTSLTMDQSGRYMISGGSDHNVRIWDMRTYRETHAYYTHPGTGPPSSLDVSQRGILAVGHGCHVTVWPPNALTVKVRDPYMKHTLRGGSSGPIESVRFRPYEDVCGIGHANGVSSIVIPGSGEPNLDSSEYGADPYQDSKQRKEAEVRSLLDKLSPDMIALDPDSIGTIESGTVIPSRRLERIKDLANVANSKRGGNDDKDDNGGGDDDDNDDDNGTDKNKKSTTTEMKKKEKKRMRGRSKIQKKIRRKAKNVVDAQVIKLRELREKERAERAKAKEAAARGRGEGDGGGVAREETPLALQRFFK